MVYVAIISVVVFISYLLLHKFKINEKIVKGFKFFKKKKNKDVENVSEKENKPEGEFKVISGNDAFGEDDDIFKFSEQNELSKEEKIEDDMSDADFEAFLKKQNYSFDDFKMNENINNKNEFINEINKMSPKMKAVVFANLLDRKHF